MASSESGTNGIDPNIVSAGDTNDALQNTASDIYDNEEDIPPFLRGRLRSNPSGVEPSDIDADLADFIESRGIADLVEKKSRIKWGPPPVETPIQIADDDPRLQQAKDFSTRFVLSPFVLQRIFGVSYREAAAILAKIEPPVKAPTVVESTNSDPVSESAESVVSAPPRSPISRRRFGLGALAAVGSAIAAKAWLSSGASQSETMVPPVAVKPAENPKPIDVKPAVLTPAPKPVEAVKPTVDKDLYPTTGPASPTQYYPGRFEVDLPNLLLRKNPSREQKDQDKAEIETINGMPIDARDTKITMINPPIEIGEKVDENDGGNTWTVVVATLKGEVEPMRLYIYTGQTTQDEIYPINEKGEKKPMPQIQRLKTLNGIRYDQEGRQVKIGGVGVVQP